MVLAMNRPTRTPTSFSKVSVKSQTVLPRAVRATLGIKPFTAQKLLEQRNRFERRTIERALAALADAQAAMVGGSELDAEFSLELALGRVLSAR